MKAFLTLLLILLVATALPASAQEQPHLYTLTIWKSVIPEGGTLAERDSIARIFFDATTKNNSKIISERTMVHTYTGDSQEWIVVTEFANWNDIDLAGAMSDEMMQKAYPMKRNAENSTGCSSSISRRIRIEYLPKYRSSGNSPIALPVPECCRAPGESQARRIGFTLPGKS